MRKGTELEGFCVDMLSQLSQKLGFKYNLKLVKDNRYGAMDPSGNWNGMIGEVIRGVSYQPRSCQRPQRPYGCRIRRAVMHLHLQSETNRCL